MEFLEVKAIVEKIKVIRDLFTAGLNSLLLEMETKTIVGEVNRPIVDKVKKIRKKRTTKIKPEKGSPDSGKAGEESGTPQIEDKPRRKRTKRLVEVSNPALNKEEKSAPMYDRDEK